MEALTATSQHAKMAEEQVHQVFEGLNPSRDEREAQLLTEIETQRHQKQKALMLQKDELEFLLEAIRDALDFCGRLLKEGSETEIVSSHWGVLSRMDTLNKEMMQIQSLEPINDPRIEFEREGDWVDSKGKAFSDVGCIVTSWDLAVEKSEINRRTNATLPLNEMYFFHVALANKTGDRGFMNEPKAPYFEVVVKGITGKVKVGFFAISSPFLLHILF